MVKVDITILAESADDTIAPLSLIANQIQEGYREGMQRDGDGGYYNYRVIVEEDE